VEPPESPPPPGRGGRLRALAIDTSPLRSSRDFRLLWTGQAISTLGSMVALIAVPYQVFQITRSSLAVGLLGLAELIPLLVLSVLGGSLADAVDRRRLLVIANLGLAALSGSLALNAVSAHPRLLPLYAIASAQAAIQAVEIPARRSWVSRLLTKEQLPAAMPLEALFYSAGQLVGPAVGGVLIAALGLPVTYLVDAGSFFVAIAAVRAMAPSPPPEGVARAGMESVREGLRFLRGRPVLMSTFVVDLNAMIFGMPQALFPAMAARFGGGSIVVGFLYAAPSAGVLLATLLSGWATRVRRQGLAVIVSVLGWGLAVSAFGLAPVFWVAALFLAVAGAADFVSGIYRTTILQTVTPDAMRGRLSGVELAVVATGPMLGNVEAGAVAAVFGLRASIVSGGVITLIGTGILALAVPAFARYDARDPTR
jgi:MFS family permease